MTTDETLAREIAALINERGIDPSAKLYNDVQLADLAAGTAPVPLDDIAVIKKLSALLRTEPWFWYKLIGVKVPRELIDSLTKKRKAADAAAAMRAKNSKARRKARRMKACVACKIVKPSDAFRPGFGTCESCSQKEVKSFSGAVKILEQVKPWRKSM
jgi:hypothetical protein